MKHFEFIKITKFFKNFKKICTKINPTATASVNVFVIASFRQHLLKFTIQTQSQPQLTTWYTQPKQKL